MPSLHPKINHEYLPDTYRLREFTNPKDVLAIGRIMELMEQVIARKGSFAERRISDSVLRISRSYTAELVYQAVGIWLYRYLIATGKIDVQWWDAFVPAIHRRMMAGIHWRGVRLDDQTPIRDLLERAQKATTTEEAAEILRSIAPQKK
jgi:hypothetical protein